MCQTVLFFFFFFDNLDWDVNDHTPVSQTGSVVWSLTSQVKKGIKKNPFCETVVWPLTFWSKTTFFKKNGEKPGPRDRGMVTVTPGQKPERRRPSSIKLPLTDRRWTPANCCLLNCRQYDGVERKGTNSAF